MTVLWTDLLLIRICIDLSYHNNYDLADVGKYKKPAGYAGRLGAFIRNLI